MLKGAINRGVFLLLTLPSTGGFWTDFSKCSERGLKRIFNFFFLRGSATKRFARSRIFRYGLPQDILSKRQKSFEGLTSTGLNY